MICHRTLKYDELARGWQARFPAEFEAYERGFVPTQSLLINKSDFGQFRDTFKLIVAKEFDKCEETAQPHPAGTLIDQHIRLRQFFSSHASTFAVSTLRDVPLLDILSSLYPCSHSWTAEQLRGHMKVCVCSFLKAVQSTKRCTRAWILLNLCRPRRRQHRIKRQI